jgi:hypothetical protein
MKNKNAKQVRAILERVPATRKNDLRLIAYVWAEVIGYDKLNDTTAKQLLDLISEGALPKPECIRIARQRIQRYNPNLK